jgi:hypothetical protein
VFDIPVVMDDLKMGQISAKFMPKLVTDRQKQWHVFVCQELLDEGRSNQNFLSRVITGVKTWVCCYDPETKQQSSQGVICRMSLKFRNSCRLHYTCTTVNTLEEAIQRVMVAKLTRVTQKIAILWHLVEESFTTCRSQSWRQVRKLLDTPLYFFWN